MAASSSTLLGSRGILGTPMSMPRYRQHHGDPSVDALGHDLDRLLALVHRHDRPGAGDAFAAGYICRLLDGQSGRDSVALGNAVARWSVRLPGNIESLPDRSDLQQLESGHRFVDR